MFLNKLILVFLVLRLSHLALAQPAPAPTPVPVPIHTDSLPPDQVRQLTDEEMEQVKGPAATDENPNILRLRQESQRSYNAWQRLPKTSIRPPVQPPAIMRR